MFKKTLSLFKLFIINFSIFFTLLIVVEMIFGSWFKNNFKLNLSSERNINRVYTFDFSNHKGTSHYIKDNFGFRVDGTDTIVEDVDIVFAGGSTLNQKFLNYEDTIIGQLQKKSNLKLINSGVDGMSILGHINSFELWFDKIDNFKPKYYVFYIGVNDPYLLSKKQVRSVDLLSESSGSAKIREYLESNSFFYKKFRVAKTILFLKFDFKRGANQVNKKTKVYGERESLNFVTYSEFSNKNSSNENFEKIYTRYLDELTKKVKQRNSEVIYIPQITGNGMNKKMYSINKSIIKHCNKFNLICYNLPQELDLSSDDFYEGLI